MSSSTTNNRMGYIRPSKTLHPQRGMQETTQALELSWCETQSSKKIGVMPAPQDRMKICSSPHCGRQVISTRTGISFLTGIVNSDGGSILKSASVAGIVPVM